MEIRELSTTVTFLLHPPERFAHTEPVASPIGGPQGTRMAKRSVSDGDPHRVTAIVVAAAGFTLRGDSLRSEALGEHVHRTLPTVHTDTAALPPALRPTVAHYHAKLTTAALTGRHR